MPHVMYRWQFKDVSAKALIARPEDRTGQAHRLVESFGGKVHGYFFALGDYDGVAICEFPDVVALSACSLRAAATGAFARFETTHLLTGAEAASAMKRAHDTKSDYRPPNE